MCRSPEVYVPPAVAMQAHSAPLGISFYQWTEPETRPDHCANVVPFPQAMDGFAFIAFHGSWNRAVPTGYKVVYVPMDENGNAIASDGDSMAPVVDLLAHASPNAQWGDGFRPVDVEFDSCGRLLVSSDGSSRNGVYGGSKIVRIESTESTSFSATPSASPSASPTLIPSDSPSSSPSSLPTERSLDFTTDGLGSGVSCLPVMANIVLALLLGFWMLFR